MKEKNTCFIWRTSAKTEYEFDYDMQRVFSIRADGEYKISQDVIDDEIKNNRMTEVTKAKLTTWLIDQRSMGVEIPVIDSELVENVKSNRPLSVVERGDRLLRYFDRESPKIGQVLSYSKRNPGDFEDGMLAWSESVELGEAAYLLDYLVDQKWLQKVSVEDAIIKFKISAQGYSRLLELNETIVKSYQAFVAMWFDASMKDAREQGFKMGIIDAGYRPLIVDEEVFSEKIDDKIIAEIKRSRFLVADFTQGGKGARGGVYFEAGFALGLGIPVIFTCQRETIEKNMIHFDTRQYPHIVWDIAYDLREHLADRICALPTLGEGPLKSDNRS